MLSVSFICSPGTRTQQAELQPVLRPENLLFLVTSADSFLGNTLGGQKSGYTGTLVHNFAKYSLVFEFFHQQT